MGLLTWFKKRKRWEMIKLWWDFQGHRWMEDGAINQNIYDRIKNEELRPHVGRLLRELFPHQSACAHCEFPWGLVNHHDTHIDNSHSVFVLCDYCWNYFRSYGQEDQIRRLYHATRKKYWPDMKPGDLGAALNKDFGERRGLIFHAKYEGDTP